MNWLLNAIVLYVRLNININRIAHKKLKLTLSFFCVIKCRHWYRHYPHLQCTAGYKNDTNVSCISPLRVLSRLHCLTKFTYVQCRIHKIPWILRESFTTQWNIFYCKYQAIHIKHMRRESIYIVHNILLLPKYYYSLYSKSCISMNTVK